MDLSEQAERLGQLAGLDVLGNPLRRAVDQSIGQGNVRHLLSGRWLGHRLHPILTDIPIGSFTSATVLDILGGASSRKAANLLVGLGVTSAIPTVAAGLVDWCDTSGPEQRIGVVHAVSNVVGVGLYARSFTARRRGHRIGATVLGLLGMGVMTVGGYLGGHLSYARGVGVNRDASRTVGRN